MIELHTTRAQPTLERPDPGAFALGSGPAIEEAERLETVETGGQGWGLVRDEAAGPDVWRLRRTPPRGASGWVFIANEGGPIRLDADTSTFDAWSLSSALGRGHLVAFERTADGGGARRAGVVGLVAVVIMGAVPQSAMASEAAPSWDELTQDVDPNDPSVPRYGNDATMATGPIVAGASGAAGKAAGTGTGAQAPVGEAAPTSGVPATGDVHPDDYGKKWIAGGAVLTGLGGAAFVAGVGMAAYFKSSVKYWLPVMLPGAAMLGAGIPLLVGGTKRKKLRGQPKVQAAQIRILPIRTRRFTGAGLTLRF